MLLKLAIRSPDCRLEFVEKADAEDTLELALDRPDDVFHKANSLSRLEGPVCRGEPRKLVEVISAVWSLNFSHYLVLVRGEVRWGQLDE